MGGWRAYKSQDPTDIEFYYHQQNDVCMLRLFEAFLESAPQLTLQVYIMVATNCASWLTGKFIWLLDTVKCGGREDWQCWNFSGTWLNSTQTLNPWILVIGLHTWEYCFIAYLSVLLLKINLASIIPQQSVFRQSLFHWNLSVRVKANLA